MQSFQIVVFISLTLRAVFAYRYDADVGLNRLKIRKSVFRIQERSKYIIDEDVFTFITGKKLVQSNNEGAVLVEEEKESISQTWGYQEKLQIPETPVVEKVDRFRFVINTNSVKRTISKSLPLSSLPERIKQYLSFHFDWVWKVGASTLSNLRAEAEIVRYAPRDPKVSTEIPLSSVMNYTLLPDIKPLLTKSAITQTMDVQQKEHTPQQKKRQPFLNLWKSDIDLMLKKNALSIVYITYTSLLVYIFTKSVVYIYRRIFAPFLNYIGIHILYVAIFLLQFMYKTFFISSPPHFKRV